MIETPTVAATDSGWRRSLLASPLLKLLGVGALILVLLIPLAMVRSLVREREQRHDSVVAEIGALWGNRQVAGGPVLTIPYRIWLEDANGTPRTSLQHAYFLPAELRLVARLEPERRNRGLYEAVVYRLLLEVEGSFEPPDLERWNIPAADVLWQDAHLSIGISDPRGLGQAPALRFGAVDLELQPGNSAFELYATGLRATIPASELDGETGEHPFSYALSLSGSQALDVLPAARETIVEMVSPWPDPSFGGSFLPNRREVGAEGFEARWEVSYFGTGLPASWRSCEVGDLDLSQRLQRSLFDVSLLLPVDHYQKTERVVKYAALFLGLTFLAFFLFEIFRPLQVHPVQYLLVGCALCMFYLLLLSLSEHVSFAVAYLAAALATIGLITGYAAAVLDGGRRAAVMGGVLATLYVYLFVLLQAQEYSLLLGSAALFVVLGALMYLTRGIDWYGMTRPRPATGAPS